MLSILKTKKMRISQQIIEDIKLDLKDIINNPQALQSMNSMTGLTGYRIHRK